jgi:hypothetical protein
LEAEECDGDDERGAPTDDRNGSVVVEQCECSESGERSPEQPGQLLVRFELVDSVDMRSLPVVSCRVVIGGTEACAMRAVADRLGVTAMSIYRHITDKADLLGRIPESLLGPATHGTRSDLATRIFLSGAASLLTTPPRVDRQ